MQLRRNSLFVELFPKRSNSSRYDAAVMQTAAMLRRHFKKGPLVVLQADMTILQEIREAKVRRVSEAELGQLMDSENLNWPQIDLVFNLDSPSTKVRVIHDYN